MTMSPEMRAEYDKAMMAAAMKHGIPVSRDASTYGWADYDAASHIREGCHAVTTAKSTAEGDTWDEFVDTFYEGDTSQHGITVDKVTCACGEIGKDRQIRWKADMQEVAEAVFEEAFGGKS